MSNGKYFTNEQLEIMMEICDGDKGSIWDRRNQIMSMFDIDILDSGDSLSTLQITKYIKSYDPSFNPNFHRTGIDAQSDKGNTELKSTRVELLTKKGNPKKQPYNGGWTFHAVASYEERYIFIAKDKKTWQPTRVYDISSKKNVQKIIGNLEEQRIVHLTEVKKGIKDGKNDRSTIKELFIREVVPNFTESTYQNCTIYRDSV